jgi:uncharacterized membrane protein YvbJ
MKYCKNCGAPNNNFGLCIYCGAVLDIDPISRQQKKDKKQLLHSTKKSFSYQFGGGC